MVARGRIADLHYPVPLTPNFGIPKSSPVLPDE